MAALQLIVGLGNPGAEYAGTRHNAGAWFITELARQLGCTLQADKKLKGDTAKATLDGHSVRLLAPSTFMNLSGQSVAACAQFYKLPLESILVAHDELDLPLGTAKLKQGGGHGGNNGIRSIIQELGNQHGFMRLRLGIGHPRDLAPEREVHSHVLGRPSQSEREQIENCIEQAIKVLPLIANGHWQKAQTQLHSYQPTPSN